MLRRNCLTQNPGNRRNTLWLVVVAQLVEPQIVVLVVAGSSPVDHPILFHQSLALVVFLWFLSDAVPRIYQWDLVVPKVVALVILMMSGHQNEIVVG